MNVAGLGYVPVVAGRAGRPERKARDADEAHGRSAWRPAVSPQEEIVLRRARMTTVGGTAAGRQPALAACASDEDSGDSGSGSGGASGDLKVGLAYDIGGRGDKSFNDAAGGGPGGAPSSELGLVKENTRELSAPNESEPDRAEPLAPARPSGFNPVIAVGLQVRRRPSPRSPRSTPQVNFAIVDDNDDVNGCRTSPAWSSPRSRARSWSARPPR